MISLISLLFSGADAHGRLTSPATRYPVGYEDDPVSGNTGNDFVCRNALTSPSTTITAGQSLTLQWDFQADHIGDCAVFISYDFDAANNADMKFFKIANLPRCREQNRANVAIDLPDWLPGGRAVLRWDWYALHVFPTVEFYAQCVDVNITPTGNAASLDSIVKYSITNPAIYPANANEGVKFRNPYNTANGMTEQFMTGPPCAGGYGGNNCALTAEGTTGFVDVSDTTTLGGGNTGGGGGGNSKGGANNSNGDGTGGGSPVGLILGALALIIGLGGGVFMWKRKQAQEAEKIAEMVLPVAPSAPPATTAPKKAKNGRRPPPPPGRKPEAAWRV